MSDWNLPYGYLPTFAAHGVDHITGEPICNEPTVNQQEEHPQQNPVDWNAAVPRNIIPQLDQPAKETRSQNSAIDEFGSMPSAVEQPNGHSVQHDHSAASSSVSTRIPSLLDQLAQFNNPGAMDDGNNPFSNVMANVGTQDAQAVGPSQQVMNEIRQVLDNEGPSRGFNQPMDLVPLTANAVLGVPVPQSANAGPANPQNNHHVVQAPPAQQFQAAPQAILQQHAPLAIAQQPSAAELRVQNSVFVPFADIPQYDYAIPNASQSNRPVNFTAVEIITFLPKWFHNWWVANRFCNNGMTNPIHTEILAQHRVEAVREPRFEVHTIASAYLDAMRGHGWKQLPKDQQKGLWGRKNHKTPPGWNGNDISVNGFLPDRIRERNDYQQPPSVPFSSLLDGVKKIPQGNDAADLTRAIEFAVANPFPDENGHTVEYRFPDDLVSILDSGMVGRTQVTAEHTDRKVMKRYDRSRGKGRGAVQNAPNNGGATPQSVAPRLQPVHRAPMAQMYPQVHMDDAPQQIQQASQEGTGASPYTQTLHDQEPYQHDLPPITFVPMYASPYGEGYRAEPALNAEQEVAHQAPEESPAATPTELPLIREDPTPADDNDSDVAKAVRFCQRPDQINIDWRWQADHILEIQAAIDVEEAQLAAGPPQVQSPDHQYERPESPVSPMFRFIGPDGTEVEIQQPQSPPQGPPASLIRESPVPADDDVSETALLIRFCQRPEQANAHWRWTTDDMVKIREILNLETTQFEQYFDLDPMPTDMEAVDEPRLSGQDAVDYDAEIGRNESPTQGQMHGYGPKQLLRECQEASSPDDKSELAQAARFARRDAEIGKDWFVSDIPLIMEQLWIAAATQSQ